MITMEDTPLGRMRLSWGLPNAEAALAARGIVVAQARHAGSLTCTDPLHGRRYEFPLRVDRAGRAFILDEITNSVWIAGWLVPAD
jgi:hypothetical protein